jgi:hypothetical protein
MAPVVEQKVAINDHLQQRETNKTGIQELQQQETDHPTRRDDET